MEFEKLSLLASLDWIVTLFNCIIELQKFLLFMDCATIADHKVGHERSVILLKAVLTE